MAVFNPCNILLPRGHEAEWAVVACDQFTSQPEYWKQVREIAGDYPSTVNMILPEAELDGNAESRVKKIHESMKLCLEDDCLREIPKTYVYVERIQSDGSIRKGIVGCIDLEEYDYAKESTPLIRASEETVIERIPPRIAVREGSPLELSHVILYADDEKDELIKLAGTAKRPENLLYDFDLMQQGGHIRGWKLSSEQVLEFDKALEKYYESQRKKADAIGKSPVYFMIGDGNHSLAAAKACYEKAKKIISGKHGSTQTSFGEKNRDKVSLGGRDSKTDIGEEENLISLRYAMVELVNIHDESQIFHPIHRILKDIDVENFLMEFRNAVEKGGRTVSVTCRYRADSGINVSAETGGEAIAAIQGFIDDYLKNHEGKIDYIHGDKTLGELVNKSEKNDDCIYVKAQSNIGSLGIFMPTIEKDGFFKDVMNMGSYPRKSFSIGEATDKRYYLEVRELY